MVVDKSAIAVEKKEDKENAEVNEQEMVNLNVANGKKNLLCGDYPEAVACFQAACTLQSELFGETSPECAEVFYLYGRALLELARVENGVLGNALKGVPDTEDSSESETEEVQFEKTKDLPAKERDQLRQEVEAAMATETEDNNDTQDEEQSEEKKKETKQDDTGKKDEQTEVAEEKMETDGKDKDKTKEKESQPSEKEEKKENDPKPTESAMKNTEAPLADDIDPDDVPNMQLAWEMLELAKVLYQKKPKSEENSLHVAQCNQKLGELGLEIENYSQAIGDFLECLVIQKELLSNHDRRLAETYYNLGLAYSFHKRYDNALEHYNAALGVLDARTEFLNEQINENDRKKEKNEETIEECAEIGEINELIPDINSKIEDVIQMKRQEGKMAGSPFTKASSSSTASTAGETSTGFGATADRVCTVIPIRKSSSSGTPTSTAAAAASPNDITHLVRRKRTAPDDEGNAPVVDSSPSKKLKRDGESNGDHANGNGAAESGGDHANGAEKTEPTPKLTAVELKELKKQESNGTPVAMEN